MQSSRWTRIKLLCRYDWESVSINYFNLKIHVLCIICQYETELWVIDRDVGNLSCNPTVDSWHQRERSTTHSNPSYTLVHITLVFITANRHQSVTTRHPYAPQVAIVWVGINGRCGVTKCSVTNIRGNRHSWHWHGVLLHTCGWAAEQLNNN